MAHYITDISICKSMTINGTGYSGQSGCISVYSAERRYDYDTFAAEDFSFRLIDKGTTIDGDEVKQIDFIYNSASLIPRTTDRVDQLNSSVYCDY